MPEELTFKHKVLKSLYGMGLKNFGPTLISELRKGGPEWQAFVQTLLDGNDFASRKIALQQLCSKSFLERHKQKEMLIHLLLEFLAKGLGEEKKQALKFIEQNLAMFPTDDDTFRAKILALQREKDPGLSSMAQALLPKIGVDMDDRELYRRS